MKYFIIQPSVGFLGLKFIDYLKSQKKEVLVVKRIKDISKAKNEDKVIFFAYDSVGTEDAICGEMGKLKSSFKGYQGFQTHKGGNPNLRTFKRDLKFIKAIKNAGIESPMCIFHYSSLLKNSNLSNNFLDMYTNELPVNSKKICVSDVYGYMEKTEKRKEIIFNFIMQSSFNKLVKIKTSGEEHRNFLHINDFFYGVKKLIEKEDLSNEKIYTLFNTDWFKLNEICEKVANFYGCKFETKNSVNISDYDIKSIKTDIENVLDGYNLKNINDGIKYFSENVIRLQNPIENHLKTDFDNNKYIDVVTRICKDKDVLRFSMTNCYGSKWMNNVLCERGLLEVIVNDKKLNKNQTEEIVDIANCNNLSKGLENGKSDASLILCNSNNENTFKEVSKFFKNQNRILKYMLISSIIDDENYSFANGAINNFLKKYSNKWSVQKSIKYNNTFLKVLKRKIKPGINLSVIIDCRDIPSFKKIVEEMKQQTLYHNFELVLNFFNLSENQKNEVIIFTNNLPEGFTVLVNYNSILSDSLEKCIELSTGDFIMFLDSEKNQISNDTLEKLSDIIIEKKDINMVCQGSKINQNCIFRKTIFNEKTKLNGSKITKILYDIDKSINKKDKIFIY